MIQSIHPATMAINISVDMHAKKTYHATMQSARSDTLKRTIQTRVLKRSEHGHSIIAKDGENMSSWIFDFRAVLGDPAFLTAYADAFWDAFGTKTPFQVCGIETSGIALVTAIVMRGRERGEEVNSFYVRKSRNKYGLMKSIEGELRDAPVILVDDLANSGQTLRRALAAVQSAGLRVTDVSVILSLGGTPTLPSETKMSFHTLFTEKDFDIKLPSRVPTPAISYEVLWRVPGTAPSFNHVLPKSGLAIGERLIFSGDDAGVFRAINARDGSPAWSHRVGLVPRGKGIFSTPAFWDGAIYFGAYDGNCYSLDAKTGSRVWTYRDADWIGSSPCIAPDLGLVYVGLEFGLWKKRGGIAALALDEGTERWAFKEMSDFTHSSPLYVHEERSVFIGNNNGTVYCFDAQTGVLKWTFARSGSVKESFAYDARRRLVVFGSFDGRVYALEAASGTLAWSFDTGEAIYATPCINNGAVFIPSLDKCVYALSLDNGSQLWRFMTRGRIFSSPTIANGSLWVGSNDGCAYELDPATGAFRSSFQTGDRVVNTIRHDGNHILVPTDANDIYCIRKKRA